MRALSTIDYAVSVLIDPDYLKPATWCSRESIALMRDLEYNRATTPGSPESLEAFERDAQRLSIERLRSASEPSTDDARTLDLDGAVSRDAVDFARRRGWNLTMSGDIGSG